MDTGKSKHKCVVAVYEGGILRPLESLPLEEHARVQISFLPVPMPEIEMANRQKEAISKLQQVLAVIPCDPPHDGLSGRGHDIILYGRS